MAREAIKATVIPWQRAVLCVACEHVTNATGQYCPACGEFGLLNLAACLDAPKKKETVQ